MGVWEGEKQMMREEMSEKGNAKRVPTNDPAGLYSSRFTRENSSIYEKRNEGMK